MVSGQLAQPASAAGDGFHAPAEEARHARTWMCWASTRSIYGNSTSYFESVQETLGRLAATIAEHEPVTMLAKSQHHALIRKLCGPKVEAVDIATDDMWARDSGPIFLKNASNQRAVLDLNFNGWGGKQAHPKDGLVAAKIAEALNCPYVRAGIVGEGGGNR